MECRRLRFSPVSGRFPRGGNGTHTSVLAVTIPWRRGRGSKTSLVGCSLWSHKDSDTAEQLCVCVCVCLWVAQSHLTLCDPINCSLQGSCVHGILQARIQEWVAILFSGEQLSVSVCITSHSVLGSPSALPIYLSIYLSLSTCALLFTVLDLQIFTSFSQVVPLMTLFILMLRWSQM